MTTYVSFHFIIITSSPPIHKTNKAHNPTTTSPTTDAPLPNPRFAAPVNKLGDALAPPVVVVVIAGLPLELAFPPEPEEEEGRTEVKFAQVRCVALELWMTMDLSPKK